MADRGTKRGGGGGGGSAKRARAAADEEAEALRAALSHRKPSTKEIESTEPGGAPTVVARTLPSFFDFYPRAKRAAERLAGAERLELLRACDAAMRTGKVDEMGERVAAALSDERGQASAPIDVDGDDDESADVTLRWQVDGGDAGWLDFDDASNAVAEDARRKGAETADVRNRWGHYTLNLEFMVQINKQTGTARPVRRVA
mmetsp:Transcript_33159/g.102757  ORF Transcript_33159/g.102757 Transcript_33159/m.102757 type:complete len:202 (-) Transcript_33159:38-643(-)